MSAIVCKSLYNAEPNWEFTLGCSFAPLPPRIIIRQSNIFFSFSFYSFKCPAVHYHPCVLCIGHVGSMVSCLTVMDPPFPHSL